MRKIFITTLLLIFTCSLVGTTGKALAFPGPLGLPPPPPVASELVKHCLNKLVNLGTITHDQAAKVSNYLKQNKFNPKDLDPKKLLSDLKNLGVTDKQAQAITNELRLPEQPDRPSGMEESVKNGLAQLATAGKITQEQADKVSNYLKQNKFDLKNLDEDKLVADIENMGLTEKQAQIITDEIRSCSTSVVDTNIPAMSGI